MGQFPQGPVPPVPYQSSAPPYRGQPTNRVGAGVLGILLGGFGIHKFVLGFTRSGLIMLLTSILTCGVGWFVMEIIGLVEGIIYLTKSEEEFYYEYVVGKKSWF